METPLNASSTTAGALLAGGRFRVPEFQREYAWGHEEVDDFFSDLAKSLHDDTYFLGLIILTGEGTPKEVVDGQQRLLTITLLAAAICHEARAYGRNALAERIQSSFLRSIDFDTDEEHPRLELSGTADNLALAHILARPAKELTGPALAEGSTTSLLLDAYRLLSSRLAADIASDPFKRLGLWSEFLSNKLYLATFVHPDSGSAYRVFEVINTRGKELTTADLLKSYLLSQTTPAHRKTRYDQWQAISGAFGQDSAAAFVQFIRHAVTTQRGHVEPRELYDVLSSGVGQRTRMTPEELIELLETNLDRYLQTMDPTTAGPASDAELAVYSVLNRLNVISIRPVILALANAQNGIEGLRQLLRLVVRRVVVGNLGTGNVERRFGQVAQRIARESAWEPAFEMLRDLNPTEAEFRNQVHRRGLNRGVLTVIRQSVIQDSIVPDPVGYLYYIRPRDSDWPDADADRVSFWASTIGNTFLAAGARRPMGSSSWTGFKTELLPLAVEHEWVGKIASYPDWNTDAIAEVGGDMAEAAVTVWYG